MRRMPIPRRNFFLRRPEDALSARRRVLVRFSPGYPRPRARLHTCYSPVRRSPAGVSKLTPPLPLDLHVLSLSLAFILSQDQTLRCCMLSFLLFRIKEAYRSEFGGRLSAPGPAVGLPVFGIFRRLRRRRRRQALVLLLPYAVYCKVFNVLGAFGAGRRKSVAKLRAFSETAKFFRRFFSFFRPPGEPGALPRRYSPLGPPAGDLRPESECKVTPFPRNRQIFPPLFQPKTRFFMLLNTFSSHERTTTHI